LAAAGELLEAHVRLEERQLFPLIEELVPDDELRGLGLADRDATCAVRAETQQSFLDSDPGIQASPRLQ
jgi:hypothetical protein